MTTTSNGFAASFALSAGLVFGGLSLSAHAIDYEGIIAEQSTVSFRYTQMGVTLDGQFRQMDGQLSFDPAKPEEASAVIEIDLASITTGMREADSEVQDKAWFDTGNFPTARFESSAVTSIGEGRFEVAGTLSIKGMSRPVVVPATFRTDGDIAVFEGQFDLLRGDFSVGEGAWAKFDILANEIQVHFNIAAKAAR